MRPSRLASRLAIFAHAAGSFARRRSPPSEVRRILVAHALLLGDTLMLTALLARLRRRYPSAEIVMTVAPGLLPLYATAPYGVRAVAWNPRDLRSFMALRREDGFDIAFVPGDNRHALLARALGARWIVSLADDRNAWANRASDELVAWPAQPTALADIFASLAGEGDEVFATADWPMPPCAPFELPAAPYAVLHVGAGSELRHLPVDHWRHLAGALRQSGIEPLWCCGSNETALVSAIDADHRHARLAGRLDLAQMWRLLASARLAVCLDSGISHLAKLAATPTVVAYGPGSPELFGPGRFWRTHRFAAVWDANLPCRNQTTLFGRHLSWVRRCQRSVPICDAEGVSPRCMARLDADALVATCLSLLTKETPCN